MANKMLPRSLMSSDHDMLIGFVLCRFDLLVLISFPHTSRVDPLESLRCARECLSAHNHSGFKTIDSTEPELCSKLPIVVLMV